MSFKKAIASAAVSAIAAGSLIALSSAASAHDWNRDGDEHGRHVEHFDRDGGERVNRWGEQRRDYGYDNGGYGDNDYGYRRHHNNNGRNVALGVFAGILGLAILSEAGHGHVSHNYDE